LRSVCRAAYLLSHRNNRLRRSIADGLAFGLASTSANKEASMSATRYSIFGLATLAIVIGGCSSNGSTPSGTGGVQGTGGLSGSGGAVGTGGHSSPGTGGSGTGGKSGTGGTGNGGSPAGTGGASAVASGGSNSGLGGGAAGRSGGAGLDADAGSAGRDGGAATGGSGGGSTADGGGSGGPVRSAGCGKAPSVLKNSPSTTIFTPNNVKIAGNTREYFVRWPDDYDNSHPYRLIIGLHGAMGQGSDTAKPSNVLGAYFGLWDLAKGSTIFVAPSAYNKLWDAATDTQFVDEILKTVEADLCIDTTRVMVQGFSQGAAMAWTLACTRPGVFRVAVGHSGGGVANPSSCQPIAYMGSLGLQEGGGQTSQTDQFARWDGCTIETLTKAPSGGHACSNYKGCSDGHPVRWCSYDGGHTPAPTEQGQQLTWMSAEVWAFVSQF
jgi:poly(3-hydroxybutyrate) depolymerase